MYKIRATQQEIVVDFSGAHIIASDTDSLRGLLNEHNKNIVFNLNNVENVCNDFFFLLKDLSFNKKISIHTLSFHINLLLFIMNYGQFVDLYMSESDYRESKRSLVNRKFRFCS